MGSNNSERVIEVANSFIGLPFRHHFKPENFCDDGQITLDSCMEKGLDEDGFDCSGLVIASICRAMGSDPRQWNRDYRHLLQLRQLGYPRSAQPGDAVLFTYYDHVGIMSSAKSFIHANGKSRVVEETALKGSYTAIESIPLARLVILSSLK